MDENSGIAQLEPDLRKRQKGTLLSYAFIFRYSKTHFVNTHHKKTC